MRRSYLEAVTRIKNKDWKMKDGEKGSVLENRRGRQQKKLSEVRGGNGREN